MIKETLLIDQGNTRLKWMLARNAELLVEHAGQGGFRAFADACKTGGLPRPGSILLSSVAGIEAAQELADFCAAQWGLNVHRLQSGAQGGGVHNAYAEPEKLGIDRWLAIIGAVGRYGKPVVIWDLGTATTLDAVDETGQHLGGMIYPGPATMLRALDRDTRLRVPERLAGAAIAPGRSTSSCIENGVFAAQLGALNQFLRHTTEALGREPKLIVTGGAAGEILPLLDFEHIHDPWLVFRGMLREGIR
ncbi:type III pantothenate kinase [Pseudomonadota bacterium]